jgi:hypothetical protein
LHHGGDEWCPKLTDRLHEYYRFYDSSVPGAKPPYLSPWELHYLLMFIELEKWNICPWIDPKTRDVYPEVRYSMHRLLSFKEERIEHERRKAEAEAKLHSHKKGHI